MTNYRPTWAEVSLEALSQNVKEFKDYIHKECLLMGVVKADAYGHGLVPCAHSMMQAGANRLGVAIIEEAIELRKAGINVPILIFGYTPREAVQEAIDHELTLTVFTDEIMEEVIRAAEENQKQVNIHIKVDSGMHRIGLKKRGRCPPTLRKKRLPLRSCRRDFHSFFRLRIMKTRITQSSNSTTSCRSWKRWKRYMGTFLSLTAAIVQPPLPFLLCTWIWCEWASACMASIPGNI